MIILGLKKVHSKMEPLNRGKFFRLATLKTDGQECSDKKLTKHSKTPYKALTEFFPKLRSELLNKNIENSMFELSINQSISYSLSEFLSKMHEFGLNLTESLIEEAFRALTPQEVLPTAQFISNFHKNLQFCDTSSESSDISSPSEVEFVEEEVDICKVNVIFDHVLKTLRKNNIQFDNLVKIIVDSCEETANAENLTKLLLKKEVRIEEGPERNMMISWMLAGKSKIPTSDIVQIFREKLSM